MKKMCLGFQNEGLLKREALLDVHHYQNKLL